MERVPFGRTGVRVSRMCLGTMMFGRRCDEAMAERIVSTALDHGVDFLDTAAMYADGETERILGRVLKGKRDRFFVATKVHKGLDRRSIVESIEESLGRLAMDYVDLYLIHWPRKGMRPEEMMRGLDEVVRSGKARFVGCSNFPAWLYAHCNAIARAHGWAELVCNQVPYNPIERGIEVEILPQAVAEGIAITVYRPLVMGLLTGRYHPDRPLPEDARGTGDERVRRWLARYAGGIRFLVELAARRGVSPLDVAIAWVRSAPGVTCPIVGVSRVEQVDEAVAAFRFELGPGERDALSDAFGAAPTEESGGEFANLRREVNLVARGE